MAIIKCPKCGSTKVQVSQEKSKHGFLWFLLVGWIYGIWWLFKAAVALAVLIYFDWWWAIIKKKEGKGYVWLSKRIIQNKTKLCYCQKCHNNFKV